MFILCLLATMLLLAFLLVFLFFLLISWSFHGFPGSLTERFPSIYQYSRMDILSEGLGIWKGTANSKTDPKIWLKAVGLLLCTHIGLDRLDSSAENEHETWCTAQRKRTIVPWSNKKGHGKLTFLICLFGRIPRRISHVLNVLVVFRWFE